MRFLATFGTQSVSEALNPLVDAVGHRWTSPEVNGQSWMRLNTARRDRERSDAITPRRSFLRQGGVTFEGGTRVSHFEPFFWPTKRHFLPDILVI